MEKQTKTFNSKNLTVKQFKFINTLICTKKSTISSVFAYDSKHKKYDDMASSGQAASYLMQVTSYFLSFTLFSSKLCECFI